MVAGQRRRRGCQEGVPAGRAGRGMGREEIARKRAVTAQIMDGHGE